MSCGVGHRHSSGLALLWLWRRPAATAPIRPLALEPPYATGVALEMVKTHTHTHTKKSQKYLSLFLNVGGKISVRQIGVQARIFQLWG